jgi:hypothetical protein
MTREHPNGSDTMNKARNGLAFIELERSGILAGARSLVSCVLLMVSVTPRLPEGRLCPACRVCRAIACISNGRLVIASSRRWPNTFLSRGDA